jgi:hypothetical protein
MVKAKAGITLSYAQANGIVHDLASNPMLQHWDEMRRLPAFIDWLLIVDPLGMYQLVTSVDAYGVWRFQSMYVCPSWCKTFVASARPVQSSDGAHLKGPFCGVMMTTVCKDANEQPLCTSLLICD